MSASTRLRVKQTGINKKELTYHMVYVFYSYMATFTMLSDMYIVMPLQRNTKQILNRIL